MKYVALEHSKLSKEQTVTVPESTAEVLKKNGWKEAAKSKQPDNS